MSHAIYQTKAFVLDVKNGKDENKLAWLYTERFGKIFVHIQSARKINSKLNPHIQQFSLVLVDLVRGKNIWRLTGAQGIENALSFVGQKKYLSVESYAYHLLRLCSSEEFHEEIWPDIERVFAVKNFNYKESIFEVFILFRLLAKLGYLGRESLLLDENIHYTADLENAISEKKDIFLSHINKALISSQL